MWDFLKLVQLPSSINLPVLPGSTECSESRTASSVSCVALEVESHEGCPCDNQLTSVMGKKSPKMGQMSRLKVFEYQFFGTDLSGRCWEVLGDIRYVMRCLKTA